MTDLVLRCRAAEGRDVPLAGWRHNVGAPVALDLAPEAPRQVRTLVVLSWNIWIGRGDIVGVVRRIMDGEFAAQGIPGDTPFVALVQEAYRCDDTVPRESNSFHARDFSRRGPHREHEIRAVAQALSLNLRYAPSMRNGLHQSDRGNAILSNLPLRHASALELPFAFQRRVAVGATVRIGDHAVHVHSAHLDPRGVRAIDLLGVTGRARQMDALVESMKARPAGPHVLGADLNLARQRREPAFRALTDAGFVTGVPEKPLTWVHTYHRTPRLMLDWIMVSGHGGAIAGAETQRLDEHPGDVGPYVFGSDHHPLVARIDFSP